MSAGDALSDLERAVGAALDEIERLRRELAQRDQRLRRAETLLGHVGTGEVNPVRLQQRAELLEAENAELRQRLNEGREAVERLLGRIRYLEERA